MIHKLTITVGKKLWGKTGREIILGDQETLFPRIYLFHQRTSMYILELGFFSKRLMLAWREEPGLGKSNPSRPGDAWLAPGLRLLVLEADQGLTLLSHLLAL